MARVEMLVAILLAAIMAGGADRPPPKSEHTKSPAVLGCRAVSASVRFEKLDTSSYDTTWTSALMEGAMEGFGEGLSGGGQYADITKEGVLKPRTADDRIFNNLPRQPKPFCRSFPTAQPTVSKAVGAIIPLLGIRITESNPRRGIFKTDYADRQHLGARWSERYIVTVEPSGPDAAIVRVLRTVYVSRSGTVFNQGVSAGHNETWLLTQIAGRLGP